MITLPKKSKYNIAVMTGSFHTDYSYKIADSICDALSRTGSNVHISLMQSLDAKRYLSLHSTADENFDRHYYSMFEYGKYLKPDLLIVSFGTISAVPTPLSAEEFFAPFAGIPVIVLEDDTPIENAINITVDNYRGMYDCVEHMICEHGLRKIVYVSGPQTVQDALVRLRAYKDAMSDNGIEVSDNMIVYGDFSDMVDALVEELLDNNPDAEAICCANDEMAESTYRILKKRGLVPGRDIAVTGFDDAGSAKYMSPPLTTVRQDFTKEADIVGDAVTKLMAGESVSSIKIPADLIVRESCGCHRKADAAADPGEKAARDRSKLKSIQQQSITNSLLLRDLLSGGMTSRSFFEKVGQILSDIGTERAFLCLADKPISVSDNTGYFLPDKLNLHLSIDGDTIFAGGYGEEIPMDAEKIPAVLTGRIHDGKQLAVFPLFYADQHYGALFVELNRADTLFYYTLSLELGTGIRFMLVALENREIHRALQEQNRILDYSVSHDSLTNCYTRAETIRLANELIKNSDNLNYIVVMSDLDYLKHINDTFGHHEGDLFIKEAARILSEAIPEDGIVGRAGGDEFICFFPGDSGADAMEFIKDVQSRCEKYNEESDKPYYLDISMGYYCFSAHGGEDFDTIFRKADAKLYIDKKTKRKSVLKEAGFKPRNTEAELRRYCKQTEEIRKLSVPQIRDIPEAETYRHVLLNNYKRISEYALDNITILHNNFYPLLDYSKNLSDEEIRIMREFSHNLSDAYDINNLDSPLAYQQSLRLLREAEKKQDENLLIVALDEMVCASYLMLAVADRLLPVSDLCMEYFTMGLKCAEQLLTYLDKDIFVNLSDEAKELIIINARYIRVVSEIDGMPSTPEQNALLLNRMKYALSLINDPFYREQLPNYDWSLHEFRTLEYICSLTDFNNEKGFEGEDLQYINDCTKRMLIVYESEGGRFKDAHKTKNLHIYSCRNAYLSGEISLDEYKRNLEEITFKDYRESPDQDVQLVMMQAPIEYMMLLDKDNLSDYDKNFLENFYNVLITYMHQTPKMDSLTFLLTYLSLILKNFIEIPGVMDFENMGLNLIAALHPPTYVHTLTVADFSLCLTRHLLKKQPALFIGMPGCDSEEDVIARTDEIEEFAYHAALCHDFGKLAIIETIITYGRDLLDNEFAAIKAHPSIGAYMLSLFPGTAEYADVAEGHHKWYDNHGGYPDDFNIYMSPYRAIVCIVTCADCLDAATDTIGRSYKRGKSFDELVDELEAGSGTRYAPFVVDLFSDEDVRKEIIEILEVERDRNYVDTYNTLQSHMPVHEKYTTPK